MKYQKFLQAMIERAEISEKCLSKRMSGDVSHTVNIISRGDYLGMIFEFHEKTKHDFQKIKTTSNIYDVEKKRFVKGRIKNNRIMVLKEQPKTLVTLKNVELGIVNPVIRWGNKSRSSLNHLPN